MAPHEIQIDLKKYKELSNDTKFYRLYHTQKYWLIMQKNCWHCVKCNKKEAEGGAESNAALLAYESVKQCNSSC